MNLAHDKNTEEFLQATGLYKHQAEELITEYFAANQDLDLEDTGYLCDIMEEAELYELADILHENGHRQISRENMAFMTNELQLV